MSTALIGYTGFVGGALTRAASYDSLYNSKNIDAIRGRAFDRIVCCGVSAVKWWANKHPEEDLAGIGRLLQPLETATCDRFVLISTVDVFAQPIGKTEADDPASPDQHAYGRHRLQVETFIRDRFGDRATIVRLPALFGVGLKKNVLFDLLNDNELEKVNPDSAFQWYPVDRLHQDLSRIEAAGVHLVNVVTEPVRTGEIQHRFFPERVIGANAGPSARYDNLTLHPTLLGGTGPYHLNRDQVLHAMADYFAAPHGS